MSDTPKVVLDALFPQGVTVAGLRLQPVTVAHYLTLQRFGNPLGMEGEAELPDLAVKEILQALFILHLTPEAALELTEAAAGQAVDEMACRIQLADLRGVTRQLAEHVARALRTAPHAGVKTDPEGNPDPFAPAARRSGLAGFVAYWRNLAKAIRAK